MRFAIVVIRCGYKKSLLIRAGKYHVKFELTADSTISGGNISVSAHPRNPTRYGAYSQGSDDMDP